MTLKRNNSFKKNYQQGKRNCITGLLIILERNTKVVNNK